MNDSAPFICPACEAVDVNCTYTVADHEYGLAYKAEYLFCNGCGTLSQYPMPDISQLAQFYPHGYHSFGGNNCLARLRHRQRIKKLEPLIGDGDATILDYGCGDGAFILEAVKYLPEITYYGFEISSTKTIKTLAAGKVIIIKGSFEELMVELPACNLVTMNHVIEHLPHPFDTLSALREKLVPGGVIEGQTPAADSLERKVFQSKWSGFHAPRHTVIFSKTGLKYLFDRVGFSGTRISGAFNPAGIAVSLASLAHSDAGGKIHRKGFSWLFMLSAATCIYPLDLFSQQPGIINFTAKRVP